MANAVKVFVGQSVPRTSDSTVRKLRMQKFLKPVAFKLRPIVLMLGVGKDSGQKLTDRCVRNKSEQF
jgi:hypothetical protein